MIPVQKKSSCSKPVFSKAGKDTGTNQKDTKPKSVINIQFKVDLAIKKRLLSLHSVCNL
jgi:hypothetical protein